MKTAIIIGLLGALTTVFLAKWDMPANYNDDVYEQMFMDYVAEFRKSYSSQEEFSYRAKVFKENFKKVDEHNRPETSSYKMAINEFSDMTEEEFNLKLGFVVPKKRSVIYDPLEGVDIHNEDWTIKGKVHPVKDQGSCGSCYAFSAVAVVESAIAIRDNVNPPDLSEQQIVDCDTREAGCAGGFNGNAL